MVVVVGRPLGRARTEILSRTDRAWRRLRDDKVSQPLFHSSSLNNIGSPILRLLAISQYLPESEVPISLSLLDECQCVRDFLMANKRELLEVELRLRIP